MYFYCAYKTDEKSLCYTTKRIDTYLNRKQNHRYHPNSHIMYHDVCTYHMCAKLIKMWTVFVDLFREPFVRHIAERLFQLHILTNRRKGMFLNYDITYS